MARLLRLFGSIVVLVCAVYGITWFVMAESVVATICRNRLVIVSLDAAEAEARQDWLAAAHGYAHLLRYDQNDLLGCSSSELNDKSSLLPFALLLIDARWPNPDAKPVVEPRIARERYDHALLMSGKKLMETDSSNLSLNR